MTHQREAVELLPCPFCGSDDVRFEPTYIDNDNWGCIACKACSAEADYGSRKDATSFWNTRADGARVPLAGLEGAEDWEVGPCVDRLGHVTSWDINIKPEPDAKGVAVIASVYSGEKVARAILAAIRLAMRSQQSGNSHE